MYAFSCKHLRVNCIKLCVIEFKFLFSSFQSTFVLVVLAYFCDCIFVNSLISVVIGFALLTLYQDKFAWLLILFVSKNIQFRLLFQFKVTVV